MLSILQFAAVREQDGAKQRAANREVLLEEGARVGNLHHLRLWIGLVDQRSRASLERSGPAFGIGMEVCRVLGCTQEGNRRLVEAGLWLHVVRDQKVLTIHQQGLLRDLEIGERRGRAPSNRHCRH